jgi:hypothetical protein
LTDEEIAKIKEADAKKLEDNSEHKPFKPTGAPECLKSIYIYHFKKEDNGLLYFLHKIITIRNNFIHPGDKKLQGKPLSKYDLLKNNDFNDDTLIFSSDDFYEIFMEMAKEKVLILQDGRINIKNTIVDHPVGVKMVLAILRRFYECIKEISLSRR